MAQLNNISIQVVVAKLYRDLGLEDPNYELDFIEWIGEALSFIGSYSQYEQKNATLSVTSYSTTLPNDLIKIQQVSYDKKIIQFNPTSFFLHEENSPNIHVTSEESYTVVPGYIKTSFEEGDLFISYLSLPKDSDGYPLVPDNQYFLDALFWYCYRQMLLKGYQSRVKEITYFFADEKWRFYCTAARNQANYPSIDEYERFNQIWKGLLPSGDLHSTGFNLLEKKKTEIETVEASNIVTTPITINPDPNEP